MSDTQTVKFEDEQISLADLAGLNLDDVAAKRGESLPKSVLSFEVMGGEDMPDLKVLGDGEKAKPGAVFKFKVIDVVGVTDPEFTGNPTDLIGKVHTETKFLTTTENLGYCKGLIIDLGGSGKGTLKEQLNNLAGLRFTAPIGKRKDPNDTDKIYTNIVQGKIKKIAVASVSEIAGKVG